MIYLRKSVPGVYYNESRDFQTIGRAFEALLNSIKTNVDLMEGLPFSRNCDIRMLPLLAQSLGFDNKRDYSKDELMALCSSFSLLLRNKGSMLAIQQAVNIMLNAKGIDSVATVMLGEGDDRNCIFIYIPRELDDTTILEDIFEYILPCGFFYRFIYSDKPNTYEGAYVGIADNYAYGKYNATSSSATIGLVSTPSNIGSPEMPSSEHEVAQDNLSMVQTGTILNPNIYTPQE